MTNRHHRSFMTRAAAMAFAGITMKELEDGCRLGLIDHEWSGVKSPRLHAFTDALQTIRDDPETFAANLAAARIAEARKAKSEPAATPEPLPILATEAEIPVAREIIDALYDIRDRLDNFATALNLIREQNDRTRAENRQALDFATKAYHKANLLERDRVQPKLTNAWTDDARKPGDGAMVARGIEMLHSTIPAGMVPTENREEKETA